MRILMLAIVLFGVGCKSKKPDATQAPGSGSAVVTTPAPDAAVAETPKVQTSDDLAARYEQCTASFGEGNWDAFRGCYATTASFEAPGLGGPARALDKELEETKRGRADFPDYQGAPQLVMVSGKDVIAIVHITGTHTRDGKQGNKVGHLLGHVVTYDDAGLAIRDRAFFDVTTLMAQLGQSKQPARAARATGWPTKMSQISKGDDSEKANLATLEKLIDAMNARDAKTLGDVLADDLVWSVQPRPADIDKRAVLAAQAKAPAGGKIVVEKSWAAGSYVAAIATVSGMPAIADGKVAVPVLAVFELANGKVKAAWLFYQRKAAG